MKDIIDWLNNPKDYKQGVHLYDLYGGYKSVVTMLTNHHNKEKLVTVLRELKNKLPSKSTPVTTTTTTTSSSYLSKIDTAWHKLYAEMSLYHARMAAVDTDEQRRTLAQQVLQLERQCATHWEQRDYYVQNGKPMPVKPVKPKKVTKSSELSANDHKRLTNLRTYLSINKRELSGIQAQIQVTKDKTLLSRLHAKQSKKVAQMAEKEAEIKKLENNETT